MTALVSFALSAMLAASAPAPAPAPAPVVAMAARDGKPVALSAYQGRVLVLDFWASWCGPCRKSFPFLEGLQSRYASQGLAIVGLSLDDDDDAVATFLEEVPASFTIARDPSGRAGEAFGVVAMPTTFLIDREGRIAARFEGGTRASTTRSRRR